MYAEAKKLHLIEELLKIESDAVLAEIEKVMSRSKPVMANRKDFKSIVGSLSTDEINELERNIDEGCEQINEDEWK